MFMADVIDRFMQARREHAAELLRQAQAELRSVEATASHNSDPEWAQELIRCRKNVEAARESLREFEELVRSSGERTH
jgi:hypothetical protein